MAATRGLTPEQWAEVKRAYQAGEAVAAISKRLSVRRQTIMDRAKREMWTAQATAHVRDQSVRSEVRSKVISMATRQAVEAVTEAGVVDDLAALMLAQVRLAKSVTDRAIEIARTRDRGEAETFRAMMSGVKDAFLIGREAAGKVPGDPSVARKDADAIDAVIFDADRPAAESA